MSYERTANFDTKCEPCVFKTMENGEQVGCQLGRLGKYKQRGLAESDGDYYKIKTFCKACRNEEWAEDQDDIFESIEQETRVRCDLVIIAEDTINSEILTTIRSSVAGSKIYPNKIFVILNSPSIKIVDLFDSINNELKELNVKFEIIKVLDEDKPILEYVDDAVRKSKAQYYALFNAGNSVPRDFIETIDNLLNVELSRFVMIDQPDKYKGLVVQNHIHKLLMGNKEGATIEEKIRWLANEQNNNALIKKWEYNGQPA